MTACRFKRGQRVRLAPCACHCHCNFPWQRQRWRVLRVRHALDGRNDHWLLTVRAGLPLVGIYLRDFDSEWFVPAGGSPRD
jgi:hypothetical protein